MGGFFVAKVDPPKLWVFGFLNFFPKITKIFGFWKIQKLWFLFFLEIPKVLGLGCLDFWNFLIFSFYSKIHQSFWFLANPKTLVFGFLENPKPLVFVFLVFWIFRIFCFFCFGA